MQNEYMRKIWMLLMALWLVQGGTVRAALNDDGHEIYYLKNVYRQMFLTGANMWGTHASVAKHGSPWRLEEWGENVYALESGIYNGDTKHYLGSNAYVDADAVMLNVQKENNGYYTIKIDGSLEYLVSNAYDTNVDWRLSKAEKASAQWEFVSHTQMMEGLYLAKPSMPADATFLITSPNFSRSMRTNNLWNGTTPVIGGNETNYVAQCRGADFDTYQELENVPNGTYVVMVQGFCFNYSGEQNSMPKLYANDASVALYDGQADNLPDSKTSASGYFLDGLYTLKLTVNVTDNRLRIGVRKQMGTEMDDAIFDNFELYYAGTFCDAGDIVIPEPPVVEEEEMTEDERPRPSALDQLTDVATVYINTFDGSDITSRTNYTYATMWEVNGIDTVQYDSLRIRGRGNSTWGLSKKPYRLKFNEKAKLLGKGYANTKNWVLMANHADKTMLRNATANFIGKKLGLPFNPGSRFVDLVLNNSYRGTYQITDHIDIRKHRVDITEQEFAAVDTSDITGGYLIEADGFAAGDPVWFNTSWNVPVSVKSPDEDVVNQDQIDYIRDFINDFESRLSYDVLEDPQEGYRSVVDSTTLAAWILSTEFTANVDGYFSAFLYKERQDDKLYFGPLWDYDIAFNNCNRKGDVTRRLMMYDGFGNDVVAPWVRRMYEDPWMKNLLSERWGKAIRKGIVDKTLAYVDSMALVIDQTQALNSTKWPLDRHVYNEITLYSTYQEGVDYMKKFIREHASYLCEVFGVDENATDEPDEDKKEDEGDAEGGGNEGGDAGVDTGDDAGGEDKEDVAQPEFDGDYYYRILNVGNQHAIDITESETDYLCTWTVDEEREETQLWEISQTGQDEEGLPYYSIVSAHSSLAVTDENTPGEYGGLLVLLPLEGGNEKQQWQFIPTAENWAIVNRATRHALNNNGGSSNDGNSVISWKNDADNPSKTTRQWIFEMGREKLPDAVTDMAAELEYRVVYDPLAQVVRLRQPIGQQTSGIMSLYTLSGTKLATSDINLPLSLQGSPNSVFLLTWTIGGKTKSVKFAR